MRAAIALLMLVSSTAFAEPKLQEPWSRGDYRGTLEQFEKLVGMKNAACVEEMCLDARVANRSLEITLRFSTLTAARAFTKTWGKPFRRDHWRLEAGKGRLVHAHLVQGDEHTATIRLEDFVPLKEMLFGNAPTALATIIGKPARELADSFGERAPCSTNYTTCTLWMPANEVDLRAGLVHVDDQQRVTGVGLNMTCETDCEVGRSLREFMQLLGEPTIRIDENTKTKVVTFGKKPIVITWPLSDRKHANVCVGKCRR